ncbi:hypothetical protein HG66A1_19280 [Gimesia chilikensis]|uniref:Uncharacterized protein n=1 Tax=Gimesia chilikensis TaxID=2605989 RepID=A0A517PL87_9PLAN|nr:hypothetical protein HG66A1_19280 [Gimesia chilikensis]
MFDDRGGTTQNLQCVAERFAAGSTVEVDSIHGIKQATSRIIDDQGVIAGQTVEGEIRIGIEIDDRPAVDLVRPRVGSQSGNRQRIIAGSTINDNAAAKGQTFDFIKGHILEWAGRGDSPPIQAVWCEGGRFARRSQVGQ